MVIVITGAAGAGKSTVGARLAGELGWAFHDADDFHPPESVSRMRAGMPLGDAERGPWLAALAALVAALARDGTPAVLACSALKRDYRRMLVPPGPERGAVRFVHLRAAPALLAARLADRGGHFFPANLLASQVADLEPPGDGEPAPVLVVDAGEPVDRLVARIREAFGV